MQWILMTTLVVHVLSGVFWAGSSFGLARGRLPLNLSMPLRTPQRGAATVAILSGVLLGYLAHRGGMGPSEIVLAAGAATALVAFGLQLVFGLRAQKAAAKGALDEALTRSVGSADRAAALLLMLTVACMAASKYAASV
jgi:hypothetical protein